MCPERAHNGMLGGAGRGSEGENVEVKCHLCESAAVAVFRFPAGCACSSERVQALCAQHACKATPQGGMLLINDLTVDNEFTQVWLNSRRGSLSSTGKTRPR